MDQKELRALCEGALRTALVPGAYMENIKSIRGIMLDDDFRRLYGCILLYELFPRVSASEKDKDDLALTLSQNMELSKEATITALAGCISAVRDWMLPVLSADTPCLALGTAMFIMLYAGPHDTFDETDEALSVFRGLSPDMPADSLLHGVFSDREYWKKDILDDEALTDLLQSKLTDLQLLGIRDAIRKTCDERAQ